MNALFKQWVDATGCELLFSDQPSSVNQKHWTKMTFCQTKWVKFQNILIYLQIAIDINWTNKAIVQPVWRSWKSMNNVRFRAGVIGWYIKWRILVFLKCKKVKFKNKERCGKVSKYWKHIYFEVGIHPKYKQTFSFCMKTTQWYYCSTKTVTRGEEEAIKFHFWA